MSLDAGAFDDDKALFNLIVVAARRGDVERLKTLADSGRGINAGNGFGETALHVCCQEGNLTGVKALLAAGADKNAASNICQTPLGLAMVGGHGEIVKTLLDSGADPNQLIDFDTAPLLLAASSGNIEFIRLPMQHKAEQLPDPKSSSDPAIVAAARCGQVEALRVMHEEFGVSLETANTSGITPLSAAITGKSGACFDYLMEKGADFHRLDTNGNSMLIIAAQSDNDEAALALLRRGLAIDAPGYLGMTPLMNTAIMNAVKTAKLLLDNGANIDAVTSLKVTARDYAVNGKKEKIVALIDAEARRRHLIAVEKDSQHAHGGVQGEVKVRKPLSFRNRPL